MIIKLPRASGSIEIHVHTLETDYRCRSGLQPTQLEVPEDTVLLVFKSEGQGPALALIPGEETWKSYDPEGQHNIEELRKPECDPECEDLDEDEDLDEYEDEDLDEDA